MPADPANGHAYVDLGLRSGGNKILFATMNIGASSVTDNGNLYYWGGVEIADDTVYAPYYDGSTWTKYNLTDGKRFLDPEDDVATVLWGGNWRMPDCADFEYLDDVDGDGPCTLQWTDNYNSTGVAGLIVSGRGDYAGNSIFLPIDPDENRVMLWSRQRQEGSTFQNAYLYRTNDDDPDTGATFERNSGDGFAVRPVLVIPE